MRGRAAVRRRRRAARRSAAAVRARIARDPWARSLGIDFVRIGPGAGRAALTLTARMVNFQGAPHGGVIFSLADAAFSAACNGHGEAAVALTVAISYLTAAPPGSRLVADAREIRQGQRAGFYEVTVTTGGRQVVARAHAVAHRLGVPLLALTGDQPVRGRAARPTERATRGPSAPDLSERFPAARASPRPAAGPRRERRRR